MKYFWVAIFAWVVACSSGGEPSTTGGSETGSLGLECETSELCGDLECISGLCSQPCEGTNSCADLGPDVSCVEGCEGEDCTVAAPTTSVCLKRCENDSDCGNTSLSCFDGTCIETSGPECRTGIDCRLRGLNAGCFENVCVTTTCELVDFDMTVVDGLTSQPVDLGAVCLDVPDCFDESFCFGGSNPIAMSVPISANSIIWPESPGYLRTTIIGPTDAFVEYDEIPVFAEAALISEFDKIGASLQSDSDRLAVIRVESGTPDDWSGVSGHRVTEAGAGSIHYASSAGVIDEQLSATSASGFVYLFDNVVNKTALTVTDDAQQTTCSPRLGHPAPNGETIEIVSELGNVSFATVLCE